MFGKLNGMKTDYQKEKMSEQEMVKLKEFETKFYKIKTLEMVISMLKLKDMKTDYQKATTSEH